MLCLAAGTLGLAVGVAAAQERVGVSDGESGPARVVVAQNGGVSDPPAAPERRVVRRESTERVDAVVIALYSIAGAMTVALGAFVWHTSPRRRMRLARARSQIRAGAVVDSRDREARPAGPERRGPRPDRPSPGLGDDAGAGAV